MEETGIWEQTTVLVSSDHAYRNAKVLDGKLDLRVPFLLKLAGQRDSVAYDSPMKTLVTHDLLLAILRGELSDAWAASSWLKRCSAEPEFQKFPTLVNTLDSSLK